MKQFLLLFTLFLSITAYSQKVFEVISDLDDGSEGTLRFAIENAQAEDEINILVEKIVLNNPLKFPFNIYIHGLGAGKTIIDGSNLGNSMLVFEFDFINQGADIDTLIQEAGTVVGSLVEDLTFENGTEDGDGGSGGAVYLENGKTVTFRNVSFINNVARDNGGALATSENCQVTLENCVFEKNHTQTGKGGAVSLGNFSFLTIEFTHFNNNYTEANSGGAIHAESDMLVINCKNSTFSNNISAVDGGAINIEENGSGSFTFTQCTFYDNQALNGYGGALHLPQSGFMQIRHSTLYKNQAFIGGGIAVGFATVMLDHTIVAGNSATEPAYQDLFEGNQSSYSSNGFNFIGELGVTLFNPQPTDLVDLRDPQLEPLADNGGPTPTNAPSPNSIVVDKGDPDFDPVSFGIEQDQRGGSFDRLFGAQIDIGAIEQQTSPCDPLIVTNTLDDLNCGSLRAAVQHANATPGANTIIFRIPSNGTNPLIALNASIDINDTLYINGTNLDLNSGTSAPVIITTGSNTGSLFRVFGGDESIISGFYFSESASAAIIIRDANRVKVYANTFGASNNTIPLTTGNQRGIIVRNSFGNLIGGTKPNLFLSNTDAAVWIDSLTSKTNAIVSNNTFSCNGLAIVNDNYSTPSVDTLRPTQIIGRANPGDIIEIYEDTTCGKNQGSRFILSVTADANGRWEFSQTGQLFYEGISYTTTATSSTGNTSPFSSPKTVENCNTRPVFDAGDDIAICADSVVFRPTVALPTGWNGSWSILNNIFNLNVNEIGGDSIQVGPYIFNDTTTLVWEVNNGLCTFYDSLDIIKSFSPFVELYNESYCGDTTTLYASGTSGNLTWSIIEGTGRIVNPNAEFAKLTDVAQEDSVRIELAISNGFCPIVKDTAYYKRQKESNPEITINNISSSSCTDSIQSFHANVNIKDYQQGQGYLSWFINGDFQDINADTLVSFNLKDGDTVSAVFELFPACASSYSDTSNTIIVDLSPRANAGIFNQVETNICQTDSSNCTISNFTGNFHNWYRSIDGGLTRTSMTNGIVQDTIVKRPAPANNAIDEIIYYHETGNACDTAITSITFYLDRKAIAGTIATATSTVCEGTTINLKLTNSNADYYRWEFFDGAAWSSDEIPPSDSVNITVSDTVMYRAIAFPNVESACITPDTSNSVTINVAPRAEAGAIIGSSFICLPETANLILTGSKGLNYTWLESNGGVYTPVTNGALTNNSASIFLPRGSQNQLVYAVEVGGGCDTVMTEDFYVFTEETPLIGDVTASASSVCINEAIDLTISNFIGSSLDWETNDGTGWKFLATNNSSINTTITKNAAYRANILNNESACTTEPSDSVYITVTPPAIPATITIPNTTLCAMDSITLKYTGVTGNGKWFVSENGNTYTETIFPSMVGDSIADNVVFTNTTNSPIVYSIFVQTTTSCDSAYSDTINITVNPKPIIDSMSDVTSCDQYKLPTITGTNLSSNAAYYSLPNGGGTKFLANDLITKTTPLYLFDESGTTPNCIDEQMITITIDSIATIDAGADQIVCESELSINLSATFSGATGITWSSKGTGTFSNLTSLNSSYTLSSAELSARKATLYVTSINNPSCASATDSLEITLSPIPLVDAGPDQNLTCYDGSGFSLQGSISNATGGIWSNYEGTLSPSEADLNATYFPSQNEINNGFIQLILTSDASGVCQPISDTVELSVNNYQLILSDDVSSIFAGDSIVIDVLINDLVDGGSSSISLVNSPAEGSAYFNNSNQLVYKSTFGFIGTAEMDYAVENQCGFVDQATLLITVTNTTPTATDTSVSLTNQTSFTFDLRDLFNDSENNILFDSATVLPNTNVGTASISGFNLTVDYSNSNVGSIDSFYVKVLDAGNTSVTALIKITLTKNTVVANAGVDKTINTFSTTMNASSASGASTYWSPVNGLVFNDITNPNATVSGFNPNKSPYFLVWNVNDGNTINSDTVKIIVTNVPPVVVIKAPQIIIKKSLTVIRLDSLVTDSNRNLSTISIITPFINLDKDAVLIDNEELTITIDLSKSGLSDTTNIVDSLEYEICDEFNTCDRAYIKVLREGINISELTLIDELSPNTIYNFLSPNDDILNSNFFFDIKIVQGSNISIVDIVTDNRTDGSLKYSPDFANTFSELIDRIEVVIFNRWGDQIISYKDYYGGNAFNKGEIIDNEVPDEYVWRGKDKNGNSLINGTYYFYVKIISKVSDETSTNGFIELRD